MLRSFEVCSPVGYHRLIQTERDFLLEKRCRKSFHFSNFRHRILYLPWFYEYRLERFTYVYIVLVVFYGLT